MRNQRFPWGKALTLFLVVAWISVTLVVILRGPSQHGVAAYEDDR